MLDWKMAAAIAAVVIVIGGAVGYVLVVSDEKDVLRLATTTSTYDSGLLDYVLPEFEKRYDCKVDVIAVGSGQAMEMGKRGDADVLLVHSPSAEIDFMNNGYGETRTQIMYNNYIVVGPDSDPAGTGSAKNTTTAFQKIYDNGTRGQTKFISRGDNSGTHNKELSLWESLGLDASTFSNTWYLSVGQGMGAVLDMCEEKNAYTLSDDATYYQRVEEKLVPHMNIAYNKQKSDSTLKNQYSVIPVNSTMWPHVNHALSLNFTQWIISKEAQDVISSYEKYGQQLFFPNAPGYTPQTLSVTSLCARNESASSSMASSLPSGDEEREAFRAGRGVGW